MKTGHKQQQESRRPGFEADLEASLGRLFRGRPALCGFSVQQSTVLTRERAACRLEGDLWVADLVAFPAVAGSLEALRDDVAAALLELIDERPEAGELLRGRTFARTLN
ncbi:MAG TPA: hypothetical protein VNH80_07025 [Burkholderiales bacterium]|nr:hypothetical protein [Burkholderiales bacterium]